jgi:glycerophosphoryl diester phosphodiesterase
VTLLDRPLLIAHRYGNHLDQIERASVAGAHQIEIDVWLHRGRLEVGHDKTLGPIPLRWDRWSLAFGRNRKLALADVLRELPAHVEPMLDLKGTHPGLPDALLSLLEEEFAGRPYTVASQNWEYVDRFLEIERAHVIRSIGSAEALERMQSELGSWTGAAVGFHFELLSPDVIEEFSAESRLIVTWTVNSLAQATELLQQGVGGIISDNLELIRAIRGGAAN